jgi:hypothetical protein
LARRLALRIDERGEILFFFLLFSYFFSFFPPSKIVCRVYGFEEEVKTKYDDLIYEMFVEVFNHLPLFSLVNKTIFVVHGGLFHETNVSIDRHLDNIPRSQYFVKPPIPYPV